MTEQKAPRVLLSGQEGGMSRYIRAVRKAGGHPVGGYCPELDLNCQGLLLCGGGDLDPALFGQEDRGSHPPDPKQDRAELELARAFLQAGKPILGICRGMQVLNVALGGTLCQDLRPELVCFHQGAGDVYHPIRMEEDSLLWALYGPRAMVNSNHHQAVDRLGEGLRASTWAEGGFPEGLEHESLPVVGVQFHPERLRGPGLARGSALLDWFIQQCKK